jgi:hypothetical protein
MQMDDKKYTGLQDLNTTRKQNKKPTFINRCISNPNHMGVLILFHIN